jgi:uncharacterized protein YhfF
VITSERERTCHESVTALVFSAPTAKPVAVIETTQVRVISVGDVDLDFARDEGEGFESVADWREAHEWFWHSYADETRAWLGDPGWRITDDTMIVAERFRLVTTAEPPGALE